MKAAAWLIPVVIVGSAALGLGVWARGAREAQRAKAWGITRQVALRLQTDEGVRRLYTANPELQARRGSEAAFLEEVREHRAGYRDLPPEAPSEGYVCLARLTAFTAQLRGADGSWLELEVQGPSLMDRARGEGLHALHFASGRGELLKSTPEEASAASAALRRRFQDTLSELDTAEGAQALWRREPGLHGAYPRSKDLEGWAARHRATWAALPQGEWALALKLSTFHQRGPEGESTSLEWDLGSQRLRLSWQGERLVFLGLVGGGRN